MAQTIKEILTPLLGKGSPSIIVGPSGAGKSTLISGTTESNIVCNYLIMREASGKGSLLDTEIVVTDAPTLDVDKLYVSGTVRPITPAALADDDNEFIGKILYSGALELQRNGVYEEKLRKAYDNELKSPANNSLAYKIMSMVQVQQERILKKLSAFPQHDILRLYSEAKLLEKTNNKKGQYARDKFTKSLSQDGNLSEFLNRCYQEMADCLNEEVHRFQHQIEGRANIEECEEGGWRFYLALGEDSDIGLATTLLKSESGSKEYLFSNLSLAFRGAPWVFACEGIDVLTVGEANGTRFRVLRLIDTMGLFHDAGAKKEDECDRMVDILSRYHTSSLLFVCNIDIDVTVKNAIEAMREFFRTAKIDTSVMILFTKLDLFLADNVSVGQGAGRFSLKQQNEDERRRRVSQSYDVAMERIHTIEQSFCDDLKENDSRHKPACVGQVLYGLPNSNPQIDDLLEEKQHLYQNAVQCFLVLLCRQLSKTPKIRVINPEQLIQVYNLKNGAKNVDVIREGLVESKELKLYASTVAAVNRKWPLGEKHKSNVAANDWGYANIETNFVYAIGNYGRDLLDGDVPLNTECFTTMDDYAAFQAVFETEKKARLGKLFVAEVHRDVYQRGFRENPNVYMPQYERFRHMLALAINDYFPKTPLLLTTQTEVCIKRALEKLVNDIVDYQCIVVY